MKGPAEIALVIRGSDGTGATESGSESGMEFGSKSGPESQCRQPRTDSDVVTFVRTKCASPTACASVQFGRSFQLIPTQGTWMKEFVTHSESS